MDDSLTSTRIITEILSLQNQYNLSIEELYRLLKAVESKITDQNILYQTDEYTLIIFDGFSYKMCDAVNVPMINRLLERGILSILFESFFDIERDNGVSINLVDKIISTGDYITQIILLDENDTK